MQSYAWEKILLWWLLQLEKLSIKKVIRLSIVRVFGVEYITNLCAQFSFSMICGEIKIEIETIQKQKKLHNFLVNKNGCYVNAWTWLFRKRPPTTLNYDITCFIVFIIDLTKNSEEKSTLTEAINIIKRLFIFVACIKNTWTKEHCLKIRNIICSTHFLPRCYVIMGDSNWMLNFWMPVSVLKCFLPE